MIPHPEQLAVAVLAAVDAVDLAEAEAVVAGRLELLVELEQLMLAAPAVLDRRVEEEEAVADSEKALVVGLGRPAPAVVQIGQAAADAAVRRCLEVEAAAADIVEEAAAGDLAGDLVAGLEAGIAAAGVVVEPIAGVAAIVAVAPIAVEQPDSADTVDTEVRLLADIAHTDTADSASAEDTAADHRNTAAVVAYSGRDIADTDTDSR